MKSYLRTLYRRIKRNPALVYGFIAAALSFLAVIGLPVSAPVAAAFTGLVQAIMAIVIRSKVKPVDGGPRK